MCDPSYSMPRSLFLNIHQALLYYMRKGGKYVYTLVPRPLIHSSPSTPSSTNRPPIPANSHHRQHHTQKLKPRYPLSKDLSLDVKKKMIFIVRMIVKYVRTLWLSLIQLTVTRCFVTTFGAVYSWRVSNLRDPLFFFIFTRGQVMRRGGRGRESEKCAGPTVRIRCRRK